MSRPRLHEDEVDIDATLVRRLLSEQLPGYGGSPLRHVPSGGTENAVFRLGDHLAVRMPLHRSAVGGLRKEVRWLPVVAPHLSLAVPEVVSTGEPSKDYPFPWAVVRWLAGEDALVGRIDPIRDAALTLGRFVTELQRIDMTDAPPPGSEGFLRGLPLAGRDSTFRAALAQCEGLLDVVRVQRTWDDAVAAPEWDGRQSGCTPTCYPPTCSCETGAWSACSTSAAWPPATRRTMSRRPGSCSIATPVPRFSEWSGPARR